MKFKYGFKLVLNLIFLLFSLGLDAQVLENGNFENNLKTTYLRYGINPPAHPSVDYCHYSSQNASLTKLGYNLSSPYSKTPMGVRDSGIILQNRINTKDTLIGFLTNSRFLPVSPVNGGCDFHALEDLVKIRLTYRYLTNNNDSAYLRVILFGPGNALKDLEFSIPKTIGTSKNTITLWTHLFPNDSLPKRFVYYFRVTPPSKPINNTNGNSLQIYTVYIDQSPACDNSFVAWNENFYINPIGWRSYQGFHTGYTQSFLGNGALALTGMQLENGTFQNYSERNFETYLDGTETGGARFTKQQDTLLGYYLFKGTSGQKAKVRLRLFKNNAVILDTFQTLSGNLTTFQKFSLPFSIPTIPDTARIEIFAEDSFILGDTLVLDEIQFASAPLVTTGTQENMKEKAFTFYPNPVSEILYPSDPTRMKDFTEIRIIDMTGKIVFKCTTPQNEISVKELPTGIFIIQGKGENSALFHQRFVKK